MAFAPRGHAGVEIGLLLRRLGQTPLGAAVQHGDDRTDDFEVAELLGRDIHQHVAAADVLVRQTLRKVAHRRRQFALRSAKLLQHQGR